MAGSQIIRGTIVRVGDDLSADLILPARWTLVPPEVAAQHILEDLDPELPARINAADIMVAGRNFGSGTGREATLRAIKAAGIKVIVAHSTARLFFRNAINNGILVIQTEEIADAHELTDGAEMTIDLAECVIQAGERKINFQPLPAFILDIAANGGIEAYGTATLMRH